MKILEEKIRTIGTIKKGNILKVDAFLNHQVDPMLMDEIAKAFLAYFKDKKITKIATIETSGIAPAIMLAKMLEVPMVFFKKNSSASLSDSILTTQVHSYTKNKDYTMCADPLYLSKDDHILLIDDFLANGEACLGAIDLIKQAGSTLTGVGIVIEKSFQPGRKLLEDKGYDICSLARIEKFEDLQIFFQEADI